MSEYNPIIYVVSAIGCEFIKDIGKQIGKKAYEVANSLREPIIKLDIHDYSNLDEIQNKLETDSEIKSKIESKIFSDKERIDELAKFLNEKFYLSGRVFEAKTLKIVNNAEIINIKEQTNNF